MLPKHVVLNSHQQYFSLFVSNTNSSCCVLITTVQNSHHPWIQANLHLVILACGHNIACGDNSSAFKKIPGKFVPFVHRKNKHPLPL